MEQEEIINRNKALCKFSNIYIEYKDAKFNSDWNWLMPVVEKIELLSFDVSIVSNYCHINRGGLIDYGYKKGKTKIEAIFIACSDFAMEHLKIN